MSSKKVTRSNLALGFTKLVQEISSQFAEIDADETQTLSFDEFLAMQPGAMREAHSPEEIRCWYDAADTDGTRDT